MKPLGTGDPLRLGPYRLLGVLGEGGMGKVYVGQDDAGRAAAVKVLRPELAYDQNLAQRFVREARMAQAVTSTGVARVLGSQTEGGRPWMANEFLAGPTLAEAVEAHGPLDEPAVRALAAALARTLADIHTAGLIHRDLKPANIVLTSAGPRVIDFGIARPEHGLTLTTTGEIPVTPGYGAPEQVLGHRVGPPADVFSLGAVLVYAASGRRAFDGGHVAALQYQVVHGEPDLSQVPEVLRPLIFPCLAKDPALRPLPAAIVTAFAPPRGADRVWRRGPLADDIIRGEAGIRELTTRTGRSGGGRGLSRRGLLTAAAGGGVVLVGGGAAAWWWQGRESVDPAFRIPAAVRTPKATPLDPDAGDILVGTHSRDGKGLQPLWTVPGPNSTTSPPPLPIRDVIVFGASGGGLTALDVVNGKKRWSAPEVSAPGRYVSLSDRLVAAVGPGGKLVTFVPSTGEPKWTAPAGARSVLGADADAVYVVTTDGRIRAVDRSDATIRWTAPSSAKLRTEVRPRGATAPGRLVVCAAGGTILGVDTRTGREVWKFSVTDAIVQEPAIQDDRVYIGAADLTAHRISDGTRIWATEPLKDYTGKRETWSPPTVSGGSVFAMRGGTAQRYDARKGTPVWEQAAMGDARSPVLIQGTCAWIIDDALNAVEAIDMDEGRSYVSRDLDGDVLGFRADGNRVFVMTDTALTALPVL